VKATFSTNKNDEHLFLKNKNMRILKIKEVPHRMVRIRKTKVFISGGEFKSIGSNF
jgi:hypothetical protein